MSFEDLIRRLARLPSGESLLLPLAVGNELFKPGLQAIEGRRDMYAAANASGCDVRWPDGANVEFRKR